MTDLNKKLRWLIALRLLIVVSVAGVFFLYRLGIEEESDAPILAREGALVSLIAIVSVQTLVYIAFLRFQPHRSTVHAYLQFAGDVFLVTYLMYQLGEGGHTFSILYFVVISIASIILRRSAGMVVATVAALCVTVMLWSPSWALFEAVQRSFGLGVSPLGSLPLTTRIYSQIVHLAGFYAVAMLTAYLARDILRAEERLRAKQIDFDYLEVVHRDIIQSISSGLVTTDLNGVITSLNRSGENIFGVAGTDLIGVHITETGLFDLDRWEELIELSACGSTRTEIEKSKSGTTSHVGLTLSHLRDGKNQRRGFILVVEDLTQERMLQEQLRIKDRMAAIGEMATKLAHEVGNPLAAISGSVQVLAGSIQGDESQRKLLEITLKESQRLDRTVKSFLQLASSPQRRLAPIDVAALIAEDIELLRNSDELDERHQIQADLDPASAVIRADSDQIGQIFWNLARNALQAMPEGGELRVIGRLTDSVYRLDFKDTGSGMTDEEKADLFHPFKSFFDQGTGIGMAIVYRIVEEHGGKIFADSCPGQGTVIHVELPVTGPVSLRGEA